MTARARARAQAHIRANRRRERGLSLIEMLLALALLGFILLGIVPLFMGSVKSNYSANEYTSIHNLCRDRLEQLMNLPFTDPLNPTLPNPQLTPGVHFPPGVTRTDDLPPVLPDPATGIPPATGGVVNPFNLSYQVMQYQAPNLDPSKLPAPPASGVAFTPRRVGCGTCPVPAGQPFHYLRIDVTITSSTGPLGIGARVARVSGIITNPSPATIPSVADPGP